MDRCHSCWWREGSRCYNEKFALIMENADGSDRRGQPLSQSLLDECLAFHGHQGKRAVLERFIPPEKLIILSEGRKS